MRALVCPVDVDSVDEIPVRLLHILEADIAEDAGIVDEHINTTEGVDGRLDNGLPILDRVIVGDRLAACGADIVHDLVCRRRALALALEASTKVIYHNVRAAAAKEDGILAT